MIHNPIVRLGSACVVSALLLVGCNDSSSENSVSSNVPGSNSSGGGSGGDSSDGGENTPDTTGPSVVLTTPTADETGVSRTIAVTAEFDEDVLGTSVSDSTVLLEEVAGSAVDGTVSFDGAVNIATLEPDARLKLLTEYEATVSTEVADLLGNPMASAHTWRFTTEDGAWGEAQLLEASSASAQRPKIAVGADGSSLAVWAQSDGTQRNVYASQYVVGSGWQSPEPISKADAGNASQPQIAIDADGNALSVWYQYDGNRYNVHANRYVANSGWLEAELIEKDDGEATDAQISFSANGSALAVWRQHDGNQYRIFANRYVPGRGWHTAAQIINSNDSGVSYNPKLAVDADAGALVVWRQSDGTDNIHANYYIADSGWQTAEPIETGAGQARAPQIAVDADGNGLAVWYQNDGSRDSIYANRYTPDSGWHTAELIAPNDTDESYYPQIAFGGDGSALAVWRQDGDTRSTIFSNRYVAGSGWQSAEAITTDDVGTANDAQIAVDLNGNCIAVWYQKVDSAISIHANRYTPGSGWRTAANIGSGGTDDMGSLQPDPHVAVGADGSGIAVWLQSDSILDGGSFGHAPQSVYGGRFE